MDMACRLVSPIMIDLVQGDISGEMSEWGSTVWKVAG